MYVQVSTVVLYFRNWTGWLLPLGVALAAAFVYRYFMSQASWKSYVTSKPIDGSTEYGDTLEIHCGFISHNHVMTLSVCTSNLWHYIVVQTETHVNYYWLCLLLCKFQ